MRIAILSDFHFGYGAGGERANDPYDAFREAIGKSLDCDLMIFAGDLFDTRSPDAETFAKAMELMVPALLRQNDIRLLQGLGKDISVIPEIAVMGIPMVAIHGTHERRTKGLINPVEALEKAGFAVYLHCNGVVFEKEGERVAIHGMSGVPDQYAESVLSNWKPSPERGCFNIFVLHQSITEFMYAEHTLEVKKLPAGFDLYVNGHIHEAQISEYDGKPFMLTGSTIPTQIKQESEKTKGFYIVETSVKDMAGETPDTKKVLDKDGVRIYWVPLENQRKVYVRSFDDPDAETVGKSISHILSRKHEKMPIVRIDLKGKFSSALAKEMETRFGGKAILMLKKAAEKSELPSKTLEEHKFSVEEMGRKILSENLKKAGLGQRLFEGVFELLSDGKTDEAMDLLTKTPEKDEKPKGSKQTMLFWRSHKKA